ncbi:MAG: hypothetical protein GY801_16345 [bacterium]|nr:hypothetical protein [bacterium]
MLSYCIFRVKEKFITAYKRGIIIILVEIITLAATGFFYIARFSTGIDEQIRAKTELPGRLVGQRLLSMFAAADGDTLAEVVGEGAIDSLLVIDAEGTVVALATSGYVGQLMADLPELDPGSEQDIGVAQVNQVPPPSIQHIKPA